VSQLKRLRCEIVGIQQPDGEATCWYAVETFRYDKTDVNVTAFVGEPTAAEKVTPGLADALDNLDLPFASVRGVATALLRAYYHEVPASTSRVPVEDLVEHFTHLDEFLRGAVHDPKATDIANALQLERERNDALRDVGKERKQVRFWETRYQHAAEWARHNAAKVRALRHEVRILNRKVENIPALVEDCEKWHQLYITRGRNCYNCAYRNGWPERGQPSEECKNFKLLVFQTKVCDCVPGQLCELHADREEPK
jgi:hypothetical protein